MMVWSWQISLLSVLPVRPGNSLRASHSRLNPSTALSSRTVCSYSFRSLPICLHKRSILQYIFVEAPGRSDFRTCKDYILG